MPVVRLSTSATLLACSGEWPRYTPALDRGFHFGIIPDPLCRFLSRVYTGQNRGCSLRSSSLDRIPESFIIGLAPSESNLKVFRARHAAFRANGHSDFVTTCGQSCIPWANIVLASSLSDLILRSAMPFWL